MRCRRGEEDARTCIGSVLNMTVSLYQPCGPFPASNDAARWFTPCPRRMGILFLYGGQTTTDAVLSASGLGDSIKMHYDGGLTTRSVCVAPAGRMSVGGTGVHPSILPVVVDVWSALNAAEWSSSCTFSVNCAHDYSGNQNARLGIYGADGNGSWTLLGTSPYKNTFMAAPITCSTIPSTSFSVTLYDDGTFTVT